MVRTLAQMKTYNQSVVKCIADKSRGHGMLARYDNNEYSNKLQFESTVNYYLNFCETENVL